MKTLLRFLILYLFAVNTAFSDTTINIGGISNTFSPSSSTITLGETVTFNFLGGFHNLRSGVIPSGASTFYSGSAPSSGTLVYTPTVTGVYNFYCEIHGNGGTSGMIGSFTVNVPAAPTITTGIISPLTFCGGSDIIVPYTTTGTVTGFSVQLSDAAGSFSNPIALITTNSTSNDITATLPIGAIASTGYRVRVVSNPQTITGTPNGQNISINIDPTPASGFNWNPAGPICNGDAVTFTGTTSNLTGASIDWHFNNSLAGTATNTFIRNILANGEIGFAVITGTTAGCNPAAYTFTTTSYVATVSSSVTPTLNISNLPAHTCFGDTIFISGTPGGGGSTPSFSLFLDNISTLGGTNASARLKNLSVGIHTIYAVMHGSLTCASVQSVTSNVLTVTVNALPATPAITMESTPNTLISSATSGNQWINTSSGIISGATSQSFSTTLSGTYKVVVTTNGCTVTSSGFDLTVTGTISTPGTNTITGISDDLKTKISIYPNPVASKLIVATEQGVKKSELQINIYDMNQKLVLTQSFTEGICKGGKGKECLCPGLSEIDVTSLSAGLYIIHITDGNTILLSNKLVKQ